LRARRESPVNRRGARAVVEGLAPRWAQATQPTQEMVMLKKILAVLVMLYAAVAMAAAAAVDVNKATDAQLDAVKGIGPATSKAIVAERKKGGDFKDWNDFITRVKGVGEKKAASLSEAGLTVNGEGYKAAAATKKDDKKDTKAAAKEEKKEAKAEAKKEAASAKK
jgi:competence protein ComEA